MSGDSGQEGPPTTLTELLRELDSKVSEGSIKPSQAWEYREQVRAKYSLPDSSYRHSNPRGFIAEIEKLARKNGVQVRPKHEFSQFFDEHLAGNVAFEESVFRKQTLVADTPGDVESRDKLGTKAAAFAHEIVHNLQEQRYPRMPNEEREKEAYHYQYVDEVLFRRYREDPQKLEFVLNEHIPAMIKASVATNERI